MKFEPQLGLLPDPLGDGLEVHDEPASHRRRLHGRGTFTSHLPIMVLWDNTPRRGGNGIVFSAATPEAFGAGLREMIASVQHQPMEERLVFVNSWNKWADGNHLGPRLQHGLDYLEAVRQANLP